MKKNISIFLGLICSIITYAQSLPFSKVDSLFNIVELENKAMGTISIYKNEKEIYQKSIGYSDLQNHKKSNGLTKYRIGSISKTFTATIIMQLIDDGKVSLDSKLSDYFPEIENSQKITLELLLAHRSGLYNITDSKNFRDWVIKPQTRKEMLAKIRNNKALFKPNEKTSYSNTNYILLSYIAEDIEGKNFAKILKQKIVRPIKLRRTQFGKVIKSKKNEALPFYLQDSKWKSIHPLTHMNNPMGAGSIVSTASDINLFYQNLFHGTLVSNKSLELMKQSRNGMGMGMSAMKFYGLDMFGHDGSIDGFNSLAIYIPTKKTSVAITLNASSEPILPLMLSVLELLYENDSSLKKSSIIQLNSDDLDKYLGVYSSSTFPEKVTFTKKNSTLFLQATGQPLFELIATKKDVFKYNAMGIVLTFESSGQILQVNFQGKTHKFTKH